MKRYTYLAAGSVFCLLISSATGQTAYEFYKGSQYPGKDLRRDVELREVVKPGGGPREYARREVRFWPRKGVDFIDITRDMPASRSWTPANGVSFQARLIGFRGVGFTLDEDPFKTAREPAAVLRLEDGRKRMFPRGNFSKEDTEYIIDHFRSEMTRIRALSDKTPYGVDQGRVRDFPDNAKPGEPGTMQVHGDHIVWVSGSQSGGEGDPWISETNPERSERYRAEAVAWGEAMWSLYEYSGLLMPGWDAPIQNKYTITVAGTKRDGFKVIPGFAGGGRGGCISKGAANGILNHEWGHGLRINSLRVGGGEAGADSCAAFAEAFPKGGHHVTLPSRHVFNGFSGYGFTTFYLITADDPNWGYGWFFALPLAAAETNALHTLARVIEQRGIAKNGIRGLGDMVGEYAARLATFDCEMESLYRKQWHSPQRHWLERVDGDKNTWRIPCDYAPEPFGMNFVRLVPEEGAKEIVVDFTGLHEPADFGDWRASIIAVRADGTRRYSPMWNKGEMTLKIEGDDVSHWLSVAATPTAIYMPHDERQGAGQLFDSGRHARRYPWSVKLTGARPGTPAKLKGEYGVATPYGGKMLPAIAGETATTGGARHKNGGGWVQSTATVADSAYVGPDAMVVGRAQVLDHARVEGFAVVMDDAVVKDHAKVSGGTVIDGKHVMEGYSRTWLPAEKGSPLPKLLPTKPGKDDLHEHGLWANYAMDREDSHILEDYYRYATGAAQPYSHPLFPVLNGFVRGAPKFVVQDDRMGLEFGRKEQYALLNPHAVDLGEITIVVDLFRRAGKSGAIFDLGTSVDHCMVLNVDKEGRLRLVATVDGEEVVSVQGAKSMSADAWSRIRVEVDGKTTSLWLNGERVGSVATAFRACDVFAPDEIKFNVVANSRDGTRPLAAIFDSIVVYHVVHEDFASVPPPTTDAPARPTKAILATHEKVLGDLDALNKKIAAERDKIIAPIRNLHDQSKTRREEILSRYKPLLEAREKLRQAPKDSSPKQIGELKKIVSEKEAEAWQQYLPEKQWLESFEYACLGQYYNQPYVNYIQRHVQAMLGGGEMRENLGNLTKLVEAEGRPEDWRTEVDWDWRMPEEIADKPDEPPRIAELPLMRKWLLRARGPVVTDDPSGKE